MSSIAVADEGAAQPLRWSLTDAWRTRTEKRARICLNGLWDFCVSDSDGEPETGWAKVRVPSLCPGAQAWYRREFVIEPAESAGHAAVLSFDLIQTRAIVYLDGRRVGEVGFPCGEVDLTPYVRAGERQMLAVNVTAYPLNATTLDYNAPDRAEKRTATVRNKGITGDVWLELRPRDTPFESAFATADVHRHEVTVSVEGRAKPSDEAYRLTARMGTLDGEVVRTFEGACRPDAAGNLSLTAVWPDVRTWDVDTPQNRYRCAVEIRTASGELLDALTPFEFGFRQVEVQGRDILLNGTPIHIRALFNDWSVNNGADGMAAASDAACRETCSRALDAGYNLFIAGNYAFRAGCVTHLGGLLRACDASGMLYSFSLPHFSDFDRRLDDPAVAARYEDLTRKLVRLVRNHPSVILYAMSHNAAGYLGSQNPLRIDGVYDLPRGGTGDRTNPWDYRINRAQARIAYGIASRLDPTRPIYHHESGNLDAFHTMNCYLNWAPIQERSEWFLHWSEVGRKPLFIVEWGLPHIASWSSHRGPGFIYSTPAFHQLWSAEYAAAFRNDAAYEASPKTEAAMRDEERFWRQGKPFMWTQTLAGHASWITNNYHLVQAAYAEENWRAFRGCGVTAILPWDQWGFWKRVTPRGRNAANPAAQTNLKHPGVVPDVLPGEGYDYWSSGGARTDFVRTPVGAVLERWNRADCAWIGGDGSFTDRQHVYRVGETVRKTLVILNDRRHAQRVRWSCTLKDRAGRALASQQGEVDVPVGGCVDVPVSFAVPTAGDHELAASFDYPESRQDDTLRLCVLAKDPVDDVPRVVLQDTKGLTHAQFARLGIETVSPGGEETVRVVGRQELTAKLFTEEILPLARKGGRVVVFEQEKSVLEAIGFRVQTYGLRRVFPRYRTEELAWLEEDLSKDWAGASTLVPPYSQNLAAVELGAPKETWAGFTNTRVWRCGNRGAVATVIPEKPTAGDWRALVDGGFDLQYAPLLEWRVGAGRIVFCQLDVTGRTVDDPVADRLIRSVLRLAARPCEVTRERTYFLRHGDAIPQDFVSQVESGAAAVCCGFDADEVRATSGGVLSAHPVSGATYSRIDRIPEELNGLSNADWAWRGAMDFMALDGDAAEGNRAIRVVRRGKGVIVYVQVPPERIDDAAKPYLRSSRRRAAYLVERIKGNLGFPSDITSIGYADAPQAGDDPYRYFHW